MSTRLRLVAAACGGKEANQNPECPAPLEPSGFCDPQTLTCQTIIL